MPPLETPRIGARLLMLDSQDRVLLIHARDPDDPDHHWWELPGGVDQGEELFTCAAGDHDENKRSLCAGEALRVARTPAPPGR